MKFCVTLTLFTKLLFSQSAQCRSSESMVNSSDITKSQQVLPPPEHGDFQFRDATEADIDDIVTIVIDAFAPGAFTRYVKPHREEHKEVEWYCTREEVATIWPHINRNITSIKIVTVPDERPFCNDQSPQEPMQQSRREKAVALAIWLHLKRGEYIDHTTTGHGATKRRIASGLPPVVRSILSPLKRSTLVHGQLPSLDPSSPKYNCSIRPDINETREDSYDEQFNGYFDKYIVDAYSDQLYLSLLATHPTWDGHGFAAHHLHWGMQHARILGGDVDNKPTGVPVTLIATPEGFPVYDSVGFESLKNVTVQMLDGLGELWWEVMRWNATSDTEVPDV